VFANKQDTPNSLRVPEIAEKLLFVSEKIKLWHIQGCSAITGEGIFEGLNWLSHQLY